MSSYRCSSDGIRSDLYVYGADDGIVVSVATSRFVLDEDRGPDPVLDDFDTAEAFGEAWVAAYLVRIAAVKDAELVPIGGPDDGQTFTFDTGAVAADWLVELAAAGHRFRTGSSKTCVRRMRWTAPSTVEETCG